MRFVAQPVLVALLAAASGVSADIPGLPAPLSDADFRPINPAEAELGWLLFYDPVLSGNRDTACATCHHPAFGTSDGVSLGLGTRARGLGPGRVADPARPPVHRVPRNAPALFNLGAWEVETFFHDGRVAVDPQAPGGFASPVGAALPARLAGPLAVQAIFPLVAPEEMAGEAADNPVGRAVAEDRLAGPDGAWELLVQRVVAIPGYAARLNMLHPEIAEGARPADIADIGNALAAFMALEWRSDTSPFDAHLRGQAPLTGAAAQGMALFYGDAGCAACHAGPLLTDHGFHAMGQPQLGPGTRADGHDIGRAMVTGDGRDLYAFRTPSLRNVTLTGPWGHAGAFDDLGAYLQHHADPVAGVLRYAPQVVLPPLAGVQDWPVMEDPLGPALIAAAAGVDAPRRVLSAGEATALLAFLDALEDPEAVTGIFGIPDAVPSGLAVDAGGHPVTPSHAAGRWLKVQPALPGSIAALEARLGGKVQHHPLPAEGVRLGLGGAATVDLRATWADGQASDWVTGVPSGAIVRLRRDGMRLVVEPD